MTKGCLAGDYDLDAGIAAFIAEAKELKWGQPYGFQDPVGNFKAALTTAKRAIVERRTAAKVELTAVATEIVQFREGLARARGKAEEKAEKSLRGRPRNSSDEALMRNIVDQNPGAGQSYCRNQFVETIWRQNRKLSPSQRRRRSLAAWLRCSIEPKR
jgi:hypothetical protein